MPTPTFGLGDRSRLFALSISLQTGSQSEVTGRDWSPVSSTCSGTCGPGLNLRGQGASMCRCPERDKLRSLPRTRPRVALPQLMRARSGQRKHCSLLQRSSGLVGAPREHYRGRCNLSATMRLTGTRDTMRPRNRCYRAAGCRHGSALLLRLGPLHRTGLHSWLQRRNPICEGARRVQPITPPR